MHCKRPSLPAQLLLLQAPLPVRRTEKQQQALLQPYKGCLSFCVLPAHVASTEAVQAVLQNLLMLYSTLDMQVCSFKVCAMHLSCQSPHIGNGRGAMHVQVHLHAQMRKQADELRQALMAGRVHGDDTFEPGMIC